MILLIDSNASTTIHTIEAQQIVSPSFTDINKSMDIAVNRNTHTYTEYILKDEIRSR